MDNYDTDIRPLLAEFCGWTLVEKPAFGEQGLAGERRKAWCDPNGIIGKGEPDPLRSHSDCHALIETLKDAGYSVASVEYAKRVDNKLSVYVEIRKGGTTNWKFGEYFAATASNDYREGIVTLAAQIAREAANG